MIETIASGAVGAALGFGANWLLERTRRRNAIDQACRQAYAAWFTAEATLHRRMQTLAGKLVGFPKDAENHLLLTQEIATLLTENRSLITATNEAFFVERNGYLRRQLKYLHDYIGILCGELEFAVKHYGENLSLHNQYTNKEIEQLTPKQVARLSTEAREGLELWRSQREQFNKHDATCPYKSPDFKATIVKRTDDIHRHAEELRESVARRLAK